MLSTFILYLYYIYIIVISYSYRFHVGFHILLHISLCTLLHIPLLVPPCFLHTSCSSFSSCSSPRNLSRPRRCHRPSSQGVTYVHDTTSTTNPLDTWSTNITLKHSTPDTCALQHFQRPPSYNILFPAHHSFHSLKYSLCLGAAPLCFIFGVSAYDKQCFSCILGRPGLSSATLDVYLPCLPMYTAWLIKRGTTSPALAPLICIWHRGKNEPREWAPKDYD